VHHLPSRNDNWQHAAVEQFPVGLKMKVKRYSGALQTDMKAITTVSDLLSIKTKNIS